MKLLTIEQAAELLGISQKTVRNMLPQLGALDLLNGSSPRRMIRIPKEGIDKYLSSCQIRETEPNRKPRRTKRIDLTLFEPDGRIKRRKTM